MAVNNNVYWKFVEPDQIVACESSNKYDALKRFSFQIVIYKDHITHEESLKLISLKDNMDNGFIVTSLYSLENDLKKLMKFGVVLSPTLFRELKSVIEDAYLDVAVSDVSLTSDDVRFDDLIAQVKDFVKGNTDLVTEDFCYVPVNDFNGLAEDSGYSNYEMKTLRSELSKQGIIRAQGSRYAGLTRIKDKPTRVIIFFRNKLGVDMPERSKHSKKSDADEK